MNRARPAGCEAMGGEGRMTRTTALLVLTACWTAAPAAEPSRQPADYQFFEAKVRPLLIQRCFECHSTALKKPKGGLLLDSRAGILEGGDNGPVVVPGQPEQSPLLKAVRYQEKSFQ